MSVYCCMSQYLWKYLINIEKYSVLSLHSLLAQMNELSSTVAVRYPYVPYHESSFLHSPLKNRTWCTRIHKCYREVSKIKDFRNGGTTGNKMFLCSTRVQYSLDPFLYMHSLFAPAWQVPHISPSRWLSVMLRGQRSRAAGSILESKINSLFSNWTCSSIKKICKSRTAVLCTALFIHSRDCCIQQGSEPFTQRCLNCNKKDPFTFNTASVDIPSLICSSKTFLPCPYKSIIESTFMRLEARSMQIILLWNLHQEGCYW